MPNTGMGVQKADLTFGTLRDEPSNQLAQTISLTQGRPGHDVEQPNKYTDGSSRQSYYRSICMKGC